MNKVPFVPMLKAWFPCWTRVMDEQRRVIWKRNSAILYLTDN